jgi:PAS domain S-box-containing protein
VRVARRLILPAWFWGLSALWTLLVAAAIAWNTAHVRHTIESLARTAARSSFEKDVVFRQWASQHGGVYVPITDRTPPNPYLTQVADREITTPSGVRLTLMNPAYMTRQVHELGRELYQHGGHITSLKPIRPENAPDDWERRALTAFERGELEVSSIESLGGEPHLRFMRPLRTVASCLKCHAFQGYKEGEVRGGISVAVPLKEYAASVGSHRRIELLAHGAVWLLGLAVFGAGAWHIQGRREAHGEAEAMLRLSEEQHRLAMGAVSDGLWGWDVRASRVDYSPIWSRIIDEEQVPSVFESWEQRVHPEERQRVLASLQDHLDGKTSTWQCEHRLALRTGGWKWVLGRGQVIARDAAGAPLRMVGTMQDITERKRAEAVLRSMAMNFAHLSGKEFFEAICRHVGTSTEVDFVFVGAFDAASNSVSVLGGSAHGEAMGPLTYALTGTPCDNVVGKQVCIYPAGVQAAFPEDALLVQMGIEGYLGAPVFDKQHRPIGIMVALHSRPLADPQGISDIFSTFLDRVAAEMQRGKAQERLEKSEERMRLFFERQLIGMAITSPTKGWVQVNDRVCQLLGYTREELTRFTWEELTHPEDLAADLAQFTRLLAGEIEEYSLEKRFVRKDGVVVHTHLSVACVRHSDGSLDYVLAVVDDITRRKRAEESLLEAEWKFRALFEKGPIGVAYHRMINDAAGKPVDYLFLDANSSYVELTGVDPRGRTVIQAFPGIEHDPFDWIGTFGRVARTGETIHFEQYLQTNGRWYDCVGYQYKPDHFVAAFLEITQRKKAEEALRRSEARQSKMAANISDVIVVIDQAGINRYKSPNITRWFGWLPDEVVGAAAWDNVHPEDVARAQKFIGGLMAEPNAAGTTEFRYRCKDGSYRWIEFTGINLLHDPDIQGVLGNYHDITERRRLEEQVLQSQKMEAVGQLAGGVAHDFNNILAAMMMILELQQDNANMDRETRENLTELQVQAKRAADLTRQLLMFSRRSVMESRPLDLNALVANLLKMLRRVLGEHITLAFQPGNDLAVVEADGGMLEQVLMNLTVNARDAIDQAGRITLATENVAFDEKRAAEATERRVGRFVCLVVADTGCGMDAATLRRIFEPFFTTKSVGKGTGLGLATVHGIVAQHRGWIEVESELGKGTTFRIYLPTSAQDAATPTEDVLESPPTGRETLLVVEDETGVRQVLVRTLRRLGYRVLEATDGKEAMDLWREHHQEIDLLFSDMVMPEGISGLELAAKFRVDRPGLRVIISSGYSAEIVQRGRNTVQGTLFLPKPYPVSLLGKTVRECLDGN